MSYNYYRKCAKCGVSRIRNTNIKYHRFPKLAVDKGNLNQLSSWAAFCFPGQEFSEDDLVKFSTRNKVLCERHFDDLCYTGTDRKRLIKYAVPTIYMVDEVAGPSGTQEEHGNKIVELAKPIIPEVENNPTAVSQRSNRTPIRQILEIENCSILDSQKLQQKRTGILNQLNISKVSELSVREQKLYRRCRYLLKTVSSLRKQLKNNRMLNIMEMLKDNNHINKLFNTKISNTVALLLQGELQNGKKRLRGRRWTYAHKIIALELYKKSPACYKLLNRLICLPCPSTLRNLLNKIPLKAGINKHVFNSLKNIVEKRTIEENICSLIFDEMSIRKHFEYNKKFDCIDGYQDHGKQGRTNQVASNALVFMVTGLRTKWKQPVAYYLSSSSVTADRLSILIKEVLDECFKIGLNVVSTVCDMDGVNIRALELLGSTTNNPYFIHNGREIVTIPDPPHLIKCFRNLFLKYNIHCTTDIQSDGRKGKGIAKWSHIELFFELDSNNPHFVYAPELTKHHLQPNGKEKMRVKLAAQVFSHSVASGMFAKVGTNELPSEAATTATLINKIDQLFDTFNGDTASLKYGKKYCTNLSQRSPHLAFYEEMSEYIKTLKFIGPIRTPPSQYGWIRAMNAVKRLWDNLKIYNFGSLSTRRLNQDPLENFFGCVRHNCGSNYNPTVPQFIAAFKTSIISNMRTISKKTNSEQDNAELMENFQSFLKQNKKEKTMQN